MLRQITTLAVFSLILLVILGVIVQPKVSNSPDFWTNLAVAILNSLLFGVIVAAILDFQRRRHEASQNEKVSKAAKRRYLINVKTEIQDNKAELLQLIKEAVKDPFSENKCLRAIGRQKQPVAS
jgi:uncharacterized integral membrane protein